MFKKEPEEIKFKIINNIVKNRANLITHQDLIKFKFD